MASPTNTTQTTNKCLRCGKTFASAEELLEHEKIVNNSAFGVSRIGGAGNELSFPSIELSEPAQLEIV